MTQQRVHQGSNAATRTYAGLRWLMVILPAVLFVVSLATAVQSGRLETSISAYYGGPVRDVFVGVLIAIAACLIAYRGSNPVEHYNLKGAAFYALFVALVPAGVEEILDDLRNAALLAPEGVAPGEYVWSLRFSLSIAAVLCLVLLGKELRAFAGRRARSDSLAVGFVAVTVAALVAFLALALWQLWVPPVDGVTLNGIGVGDLRFRIHDIAAIFLLSALAVAVWSHAWPQASARRVGQGPDPGDMAMQNRYRVIVILMLLGPLAAWLVSYLFAPDHFVLVLEWWEIALFATFWALETRRLWIPRLRAG